MNVARSISIRHLEKIMAKPVQSILFFSVVLTCMPVSAAPSVAEKRQVCQVLRAANQEGISGISALQELMERRGEPKYLAKVIMKDVHPLCPDVF